MTAIWQGRGPQRTGIACTDCPHDWCHHGYGRGCRYLLGGMDGYEICDCTHKLPTAVVVPYIDQNDVLWHGNTTVGWRLSSGRWIVRHKDLTFIVADHHAAVAVNLGEHLAKQVGAYRIVEEALS